MTNRADGRRRRERSTDVPVRALDEALVSVLTAIRAVDADIDDAARSDAKVLMTGLSGVGKEVIGGLSVSATRLAALHAENRPLTRPPRSSYTLKQPRAVAVQVSIKKYRLLLGNSCGTALALTESMTMRSKAKNPHAAALGRLGGAKGGRARAEKLSARRRSEIARQAAIARWRSA
jgi:hypothetical protein